MTSRRVFISGLAALIGDLVLETKGKGILSVAKASTLITPSYQTYKRHLEWTLESGNLEDAISLVENASSVKVPITENVLAEMQAKFTHEYEIGYLLFANETGVIDHAAYPKQSNSPGCLRIDWQDSKRIILEQQKEGRTYVGDFHTHPRTKEQILAFREYIKKENDKFRKIHPDEVYNEYEGTSPSQGDLEVFFPGASYGMVWCKKMGDDEHCDSLFISLRNEGKIGFIGGLTYPHFNYQTRAFISLEDESLSDWGLNLTKKGLKTKNRLEEYYVKKYNVPLEYVEFKVVPVKG